MHRRSGRRRVRSESLWCAVFLLVLAGCSKIVATSEEDRTNSEHAVMPAFPNHFDPSALAAGDSVLGLRIVSMDVRWSLVDTAGWTGVVRFDGRITLSGTYRPHPDYPELRELCFFPDDSSAERLPVFPNDQRYAWLCFSNQEHAREELGPPPTEGRATVTVDAYRYQYTHSDVYNTAALVDVVKPIDALEGTDRVLGRETSVSRVASKDGTQIAVECAGEGPTLIVVHGGTGDRSRWTPMFPLLSSRFTVCAMDRRGRGGSGDSQGYSLQKEAEDVAAVVDSRRGTVFVLGHSYGAVAALEATFLTGRISRLILYEPPLHDPVVHNLAVADSMDWLIAAGERELAATKFMREVVRLSRAEVAAMKSRPSWSKLVATVHLQPRQMRALAAYRFDTDRMKTVVVPTLLLLGSETDSPHLRQSISELNSSLLNPTLEVLEGQQHNAMESAREMLAAVIEAFLPDADDPVR